MLHFDIAPSELIHFALLRLRKGVQTQACVAQKGLARGSGSLQTLTTDIARPQRIEGLVELVELVDLEGPPTHTVRVLIGGKCFRGK
jgi:hypothetical protein